MSTFTCAELANAFGWGACNCYGNPMPVSGSVSSSSWPYSMYAMDAPEKAFAKSECCEIACELYAHANPLSVLQGTGGQGAQPTGSNTGVKRRLGQTAMRSASGLPHCGCTLTYPDGSTEIGARPCSTMMGCCGACKKSKDQMANMRSATGGGCWCGSPKCWGKVMSNGLCDCRGCKGEVSSMRSATGGRKDRVATAVDWLTYII